VYGDVHTADCTVIRYGCSVVQESEGSEALIEEIMMHPSYGGEYINYSQFDVAVVKTEDPMSLSPGYAVPTFLADPNLMFGTGTGCLVFGYGATGYSLLDLQPRRLRTSPLLLRDVESCRRFIYMGENVICGYSDTNSGPCVVCETKFAPKLYFC
jgi:Trypsin